MSDIMCFKLVNGQEVMGKIEGESEAGILLSGAVTVTYNRDQNGGLQMGFGPLSLIAPRVKEGISITVSRPAIVFVFAPDNQFIDAYKTEVTGLILPPSAIIK